MTTNQFIDIGLFIVDGCIQPTLDLGDLKGDRTLETAILVSLFTDQRAIAEELPSGHDSLRGWWGDEFAPIEGDEIGSKLWTVLSRGVVNNQTLAAMETFGNLALKWLIEDGVATSVNFSVVASGQNGALMSVSITRPQGEETTRFDFIWDQQNIKRA